MQHRHNDGFMLVDGLVHNCRKKLSYHHYVCSMHFIGESGPSDESPDPLPATISVKRREKLERPF